MTFEKWKEDYGLVHEPNYSAHTEADCLAAFLAGAASRDAEIHRLQMALADTEALESGTAERCDQLREQVAMLREAIDTYGHNKFCARGIAVSIKKQTKTPCSCYMNEVLDATEPE